MPARGPGTEGLFASGLERFADRLALIAEDGATLSYAELAARADSFAARLGPARRLVLIEGANAVEPLVAYLGALRGGHVALLAPPGAERIAAAFDPDVRIVQRDGGWDEGIDAVARHTLHPELRLLLATSGSTGAAKLVRLSGAAVDDNAYAIADYLRLGPDERPITTLPMHYSYGLSVLNSHLAVGATLLLDRRSVIEPGFWERVDAAGATSLAGVPYTYELLDRGGFRERDHPSLRTLTQAGGRLPPDRAAGYAEWAAGRDARFFIMYGQTEATARMAYLPPDRLADRPDAIGVAIPGGTFRLIDADGGTIAAPDTPGELLYRGPNVMMGYASAPADLARGPELDELRTGDIAERSGDGLYRIVGRASRFCKPFGLRIALDEVEAMLARDGVRAVAAGDDALIAIAVLGEGEAGVIATRLATALKLPAEIFDVAVVDAPPLLPTGKIDYRAILDTARARRVDRAPAVDAVAAAFARAFPGRTISDDASFASLGGDSLNYVSVALELETALGALPVGWEMLDVRALRTLAERAPTGSRAWVPIDSEIVLRALAILAVVINHTSSLVVGGGANVLILLAGYNLARFQRRRLTEGAGWGVVRGFVVRIILPYYAILVAYLLFKGEFDVTALLLVGNIPGHFGSFIEPYWFLENLLQSYVIVAAAFAVPAVRRLAGRDPWRFGLALLGLAVVVKVVALAAFGHLDLRDRTPDALFYLLALGWCVQRADAPGRRRLIGGVAAVIALLAVGVGGSAEWWSIAPPPANYTHAAWVAVTVGLLLWRPRLPAPGFLHGAFTTVAAASFYIYLTHGVPVHFMHGDRGLVWTALTVLVSIVLGIAAWRAARLVEARTVSRVR